ncbi:MAG TPA: hypothetical protein DER23_08365, partial [Clostridiales bacterium]|nr:hypothetical protein [Clostridiales bacterium]
YVNSTSGNDSNTGMSASPVKTLEKAITLLETGDVQTTGTVFFQTDYVHKIVQINPASEPSMYFTSAHTRHIVFTSDPANCKTFEVALSGTFAPSGSSRFYGVDINLIFNGPETFDYINVRVRPDYDNLLYFVSDITATVPLTEGGEASYTFKQGDPFYANYTFTKTSGTVVATPVPYGAETEIRQFYYRVERIRYFPHGDDIFEITGNATWDVINATDQAKKGHVALPNVTGYANDVGSIYIHPSGQVTLGAGSWGGMFGYNPLYGGSPVDGTTVTIKNSPHFTCCGGPYTNVGNTGETYTIIFDESANLTVSDLFQVSNAGLVTPNCKPISPMDVYVVMRSKNVTFNANCYLDDATAPGRGTYNLILDGPDAYKANYFLQGFNTLKLVNMDSISFDHSLLPSVGYSEIIIEDDEDTLLWYDSLPTKPVTIRIEKAGSEWYSKRIPVAFCDNPEIMSYLNEAESAAIIGDLVYSDDDMMVYFEIPVSSVIYSAPGVSESITVPDSHEYDSGETMNIPALGQTVLNDGRFFAGWKHADTLVVYQPGDTYTVVKGVNRFEAMWGYKINYITGYESASTPVSLVDEKAYATGSEAILSNDLCHTVVTDENGIEVGFYGWMVDNKFYHAGDSVQVNLTTPPVKAVWAPVVFVDANYAGGDSDGTFDKPFTNADLTHGALNAVWSAYPSYSYGIVCFKADYVWDARNSTLATVPDTKQHMLNLAAADKPILYRGVSDDVILSFWDSNATKTIYYVGTLGETGFDGLAVRMATKSQTRFFPSYDLYFGPNFSVCLTALDPSNPAKTVGIDPMNQIDTHFVGRVYGGAWDFIYTGINSSSRSQTYYIGTGESDLTVNVIANNNINSKCKSLVYINSGTVKLLHVAAIDKINSSNYGRVVTGSLTYVFKGGIIQRIRDYHDESQQNHATRTNPYCENLVRTLVFDGYIGSVGYDHLAVNLNANGLDNLSFINGANVTFTGENIVMKANANGIVYKDAGSSFVGVSIQGIKSNYTSGESLGSTMTVASGFSVWNGDAWNTPVSAKFITGYDEVSIPEMITTEGSKVILPNDLCHAVVIDANNIEVGFYGWMVNDKFYFAG